MGDYFFTYSPMENEVNVFGFEQLSNFETSGIFSSCLTQRRDRITTTWHANSTRDLQGLVCNFITTFFFLWLPFSHFFSIPQCMCGRAPLGSLLYSPSIRPFKGKHIHKNRHTEEREKKKGKSAFTLSLPAHFVSMTPAVFQTEPRNGKNPAGLRL